MKIFNIQYNSRYYTFALLIPILFLGSYELAYTNFSQNALAQNFESVDTFSSEGYTGQLVTLPPSISQIEASQNESAIGPSIGSVIGGNWSFIIEDGQLQDFLWNATSYSLVGEKEGTFSVNDIEDATPLDSSDSESIQLVGNATSFTGNTDVVINGETVFSDVPAVVYLLNGNIASLTLSHEETEGIFTIPLYGIVTSLTR